MIFDLAPHPSEVQAQIDGLPDNARDDFDAAVAFILQGPSDSPRYVRSNPNSSRRRDFGLHFGLIIYVIRYDDMVQIEQVSWLG